MPNEKKEYTKEEKIAYYEAKLTAALAAGGVAKNVFEKIYHAEQAKWIVKQIYRVLATE